MIFIMLYERQKEYEGPCTGCISVSDMSQNDKIKGFLLLVLFDPIGNILMINEIQSYLMNI